MLLLLPLPSQFLRCWFTLCIMMEVEPRIAKQYKCCYCCTSQNGRGKVMDDGKKVSLHSFSAETPLNFG